MDGLHLPTWYYQVNVLQVKNFYMGKYDYTEKKISLNHMCKHVRTVYIIPYIFNNIKYYHERMLILEEF